jgi:hypothetical protein
MDTVSAPDHSSLLLRDLRRLSPMVETAACLTFSSPLPNETKFLKSNKPQAIKHMKTLLFPLLAAVALMLAGCESNGSSNTVDSTNSGTRATGPGGVGAGGASGGGAGSAGMGVGGTTNR